MCASRATSSTASIVAGVQKRANEMVGLGRFCRLERPHVAPQLAVAVGLPNLPVVRLERGKPAAAPAVGVDANQMAKVEHLSVLERRVANYGSFSGHMG